MFQALRSSSKLEEGLLGKHWVIILTRQYSVHIAHGRWAMVHRPVFVTNGIQGTVPSQTKCALLHIHSVLGKPELGGIRQRV